MTPSGPGPSRPRTPASPAASLRPVTTDASGLWHAFRDAWHGAGLGTGAESGPHLAVLSALTWLAERVPGVAESRSSAGVTIAWLLFLTPLLATWSAYLAGRVVTSSRVARALVALAWGTAGVAATGISQGRVGVAVVHVLLPFVLAGFCLAARRDGTFTATFATALASAVLGAFAPPLLALSLVAALLLLVLGPGLRRARALVLLVVPTALLGPWVARFVEDPRLLLSGPGLVATSDDRGPWGCSRTSSASRVRPGGPCGSVRRSSSSGSSASPRAGAPAPSPSGCSSAGCLRCSDSPWPSSPSGSSSALPRRASGSPPPPTSGPAWACRLWLAGLLVGVLAGSRPVLASLVRPGRRWGFAAAVAAATLAVVPVLAGAAAWGIQGIGRTLSVGQATLPAVAIEQGSGPLGNRLLLLRPSDDVVDFVLAGQEPGEPAARPRPHA